jgi:integrase
VLKTAHEFEIIARMPSLPSVPRQQRKLPAAPSLEIVERCLRAATGWLRTAIALAYFGTQRNGEVRATRVMDVDFDANGVNIRQAFRTPNCRRPRAGRARGAYGDTLRGILVQAVKGKRHTDFVVVDEKGETPTRQKLYRAFVALQKRLGIKPTWSFHSFDTPSERKLFALGRTSKPCESSWGTAILRRRPGICTRSPPTKLPSFRPFLGN